MIYTFGLLCWLKINSKQALNHQKCVYYNQEKDTYTCIYGQLVYSYSSEHLYLAFFERAKSISLLVATAAILFFEWAFQICHTSHTHDKTCVLNLVKISEISFSFNKLEI